MIWVVLLLVVIGAVALAMRNRAPRTIESGIVSFRREMRALAPPERVGRERNREATSPVADPDPAVADEPEDER